MVEYRPSISPGFSLPQYFYNSDQAYQQDVWALSETQWLMVDHASSIPKPGDFILHDVLGESIIVLRDRNNEIRAWYNVCRHRGSRICLESSGSAKALICPYHAWSFNLDGSVRAAPGMPAGFDKADYPLHPCHVGVIEGLIFLNLSRGNAPSFEEFSSRSEVLLARFGIKQTKIAHRAHYRAQANWKLVAENNLECYHCRPSHPALAKINPGMLGEQNAAWETWKGEVVSAGEWVEPFFDPAESEHLQIGALINLGVGSVSSTMDGTPVAPLMPGVSDYSEASGFLMFNPISGIGTFSDYAIMFRFSPISVSETEYEMTWLVNPDAVEGIDYDIEKLRALWDQTTREDKILAMNNQAGVNSRNYVPGPYAKAESRNADFVIWYDRLLKKFEDQKVVEEA